MLISLCHCCKTPAAFQKPMGPPKPMDPGVIVPPAPPLGGTVGYYLVNLVAIIKKQLLLYLRLQDHIPEANCF